MNVISRKSLTLLSLVCGLFFTNSLAMNKIPKKCRIHAFKREFLKKLGCVPGLGTADINKEVNAQKLQELYDFDMPILKESYIRKYPESKELIERIDALVQEFRACPFDKPCEKIHQIIQQGRIRMLITLRDCFYRVYNSSHQSFYRLNRGNPFIVYENQFNEFVAKFKLPPNEKTPEYRLIFIKGMRETAFNFINSIDKTDKRLPIVTLWMNEYFPGKEQAAQAEQEKNATNKTCSTTTPCPPCKVRPKSNYVASLPGPLMRTLPTMTNEIYNEILCYNKACLDLLKKTMAKDPISIEEANNQIRAGKVVFLENVRGPFKNNQHVYALYHAITAIEAYYFNCSGKAEIIDAVITMQSNILINQFREEATIDGDIFKKYEHMFEQFLQELNFKHYQIGPQEYFNVYIGGFKSHFLKIMQRIAEKAHAVVPANKEIGQERLSENKLGGDMIDGDCFSLDLE